MFHGDLSGREGKKLRKELRKKKNCCKNIIIILVKFFFFCFHQAALSPLDPSLASKRIITKSTNFVENACVAQAAGPSK